MRLELRKLLGFTCFLGLGYAHSVKDGSLVKRSQPDAVIDCSENTYRPLSWGDVNFLHTTDLHGWLEGHILEPAYTGDLGDFYSFIMRMKQKSDRLKKDLFIVDTGDTHDGSGLCDITQPNGMITQPLLTNIPYDLLTIGNHELYSNDIIEDTYKRFIPKWKNKYLAANVYFRDTNTNKTYQMGQKYTYFKGKYGTRVLAYGFLFNFKGNGDASVISTVEEELQRPWFKESITKYNPDIITVVGHIGIRFPEFQHIVDEIRKYKPDIPIAILGGHTHVRDFVVYDKKAAGIESGKYFDTIGFLSVDCISCKSGNVTFNRRYLDQNRRTYINHAFDGKPGKFDTRLGLQLSDYITDVRTQYNLSQELGYCPKDYKSDSVLPDSEDSSYTLLLDEVMPKMLTDKSRPSPPYFIVNTGSIRFDIFKGSFTLTTSYQIAPYENPYRYIPDVPIEAAEKLLPVLNDQVKKNKRSLIPDDINQQCGSKMNPWDQKSSLRPDHPTQDDFGTDGDDSKRSDEPWIDLPPFAASKLPQGAQFVDIIVWPFFENKIIATLKSLTGKDFVSQADYGNTDLNSRTIWVEYAKQYW